MKRFSYAVGVSLLIVMGFVFAAVVASGCVHGQLFGHFQTFPSAPDTQIEWRGKTVIQPWPALQEAIDTINEVLAEEYPNLPELRRTTVVVFGPNDFLFDGSCTNAMMVGGVPHLITGCTVRVGNIGGTYWEVLVRQILAEKHYPDGNQFMPQYSGKLYDAGTQGNEQGRGVIFWEFADRLVPGVLMEKGLTTSDGKPPVSSHGSGGAGDPPAPANVALREKMIARFNARMTKAAHP